ADYESERIDRDAALPSPLVPVSHANAEESVFFPEESELSFRLGGVRVYRRLYQKTSFAKQFLWLNIGFWAVFLIYLTYLQALGIGMPQPGGFVAQFSLLLLLVFMAIPASLTALYVSQSARPRRVKLLPFSVRMLMPLVKLLSRHLVIWAPVTAGSFSEIAIPWSDISQVEVKPAKRFLLPETRCLLIQTRWGLVHKIPFEDVLVDNSEAGFFNRLEVFAPSLAAKVNRAVPLSESEAAPGFTELWLHSFATTGLRANDGLLAPGQKLKQGRYTVAGVLGGGGQGNTYLAALAADSAQNAPDPAHPSEVVLTEKAVFSHPSEVVLKEYILPVYRGTRLLENISSRFFAEAELLAKLDHPGVVKLLDHFVEDFRGYLVLEYVEGKSLKELVMLQGPQTERFAIEVARQLALVLKYLHEQFPPVVHRDLSPDNIIVGLDGQIRIVDFNVARRLENSNRTAVVGKHAYLPPEQFRGRPTTQSDLYALGGTLFYLVTGVEPAPLSCSRPAETAAVSAEFSGIVAKCTELSLGDRYRSAEEVFRDLSRIAADS
ncbi:MAG TPA: serine/threonine-protein kinase, partial [Candidatus Obscuribacter sp.]|nr:serine/threonine-protein kinase [Candidatus Obscuribacter sp.]